MKNYLLYLFLASTVFFACEDEVTPDLQEIEPFLAVDAWLTNTADTQEIVLTYTRPYFNNDAATPALGASVLVGELETSQVFEFTDSDNDGTYIWIPPSGQTFGQIGSTYGLEIQFEGDTYQSFSVMDSVPTLDSITFEFNEKDVFIDQDYYIGEFWARDLAGPGNAYWIKTFKNGVYQADPGNLNIAFDAGFSPGGEVDSLIFIQPIRTFINTFEEDEDDNLQSPFLPGDDVRIEIHSISADAWFFLFRVINETNRPGGFGELFSDPLANVPTNIVPTNEEVRVVGFFSVAAVSALEVQVNEETIRDDDPE